MLQDKEAKEATAHMAQLVAAALELRLQKNEAEDEGQYPLTPFDSASIPPLTISAYLARLARFCRCGGECFIVALIYVDMVTQGKASIPLSTRNVHRLFFTCLLVAHKFWDDDLPLNAYYAKCGGVSLKEVNRLEKFFLKTVGFRLHVSPLSYAAYETALTSLECLALEGDSKRIANGTCEAVPNKASEISAHAPHTIEPPTVPIRAPDANHLGPAQKRLRIEHNLAQDQEPSQQKVPSNDGDAAQHVSAKEQPQRAPRSKGRKQLQKDVSAVRVVSKSVPETPKHQIQPAQAHVVVLSQPMQTPQQLRPQLSFQPAVKKLACPQQQFVVSHSVQTALKGPQVPSQHAKDCLGIPATAA
jgi:hypothetical protein